MHILLYRDIVCKIAGWAPIAIEAARSPLLSLNHEAIGQSAGLTDPSAMSPRQLVHGSAAGVAAVASRFGFWLSSCSSPSALGPAKAVVAIPSGSS